MAMPAQKPGKSVQAVGTPREFLDAVERRFGPLRFDLAATEKNTVVPGKFFDRKRDSLRQDWTKLRGNLWLNAPFSKPAPWVEKAATSASFRAPVLFLMKAAVDTEWWDDWVRPYAITLYLRPRIVFVGHTTGFPAPLALSLFGYGVRGAGTWRWDEEGSR